MSAYVFEVQPSVPQKTIVLATWMTNLFNHSLNSDVVELNCMQSAHSLLGCFQQPHRAREAVLFVWDHCKRIRCLCFYRCYYSMY